MEYVVGQRWVSESEPNLGLGIIINANERIVEVAFLAQELIRSYSQRNAPLIRVIYDAGEDIAHKKGGQYTVLSAEEEGGIILYTVTPLEPPPEGEPLSSFKEIELAHELQFQTPESRLFCGQIDKNRWFDLRYKTLEIHASRLRSRCNGFLGPRVNLIPHQFNIAEEVCQRHFPRVLLADEVGLGKTIEAGLILHQQLTIGVVKRALVIVPENLLHQWLVEMARRFNLTFSLFDAERCNNFEDENPFETEQLILCSLDFLMAHPKRRSQALEAEWDILIVDEAHHLAWLPDAPSDAYEFVNQLATLTPSVLLLTATPEQLGPEGHFARLRLLDPHRFHDLKEFLREEEGYIPVANCAKKVIQHEPLAPSETSLLTQTLGEEITNKYQCAVKDKNENIEKLANTITAALIDRHGTGRVLFRNTRKNISGFCKRILHPIPCEPPILPIEPSEENSNPASNVIDVLFPAIGMQDDSRFLALTELLKAHQNEKFILICSNPTTALDIDASLRIKHGIHASVFHEGLSIIERDRAAAFFSDPEDNCPLLICSEIGSEGRNFQFAHHLVLFDLPLNPDLLEQRIGRLDRIGQRHDIQIHVPYYDKHPQAYLFNWYAKALNAFQQSSSTGPSLLSEFQAELEAFILNEETGELSASANSGNDFSNFIEKVTQRRLQLERLLEEGRDPLLELNSSGNKGLLTLDEIRETEDDFELEDWLISVFDLYGVDHEDGPHNTVVAHPSNHMRTAQFPALPEDGTTLCFDRETALAREDVQFLTYDHPMVSGAIELILGRDKGNTALTTIKLPNTKEGAILIEVIYTLQTMAPPIFQTDSYLPLTPIRILIDEQGNDLGEKVSYDQIAPRLTNVKKETARAIVKSEAKKIKQLLKTARDFAGQQAATLRKDSERLAMNSLSAEHQRLVFLKKTNPSIRQNEVDFIVDKKKAVQAHIQSAPLHLHATRIIITI